MNKLAVFVEGFTEILFVEKLIEELAGQNKVLIEQIRIRGGSNAPRTTRTIRAAKPNTGQRYYVLLFDCGGDETVKTRILEEHENLTQSGYSRIIGIRDVRPNFTYADIPKLERGLPTYIRTSLIPVTFILSVMEIEAWFLAEATHYPKIDPTISTAAIKTQLGFDPETDDMERRTHPTDDLNRCYALGGKSYQKGTRTTVDALDYALVYMHLTDKFSYLKQLISLIDTFLA